MARHDAGGSMMPGMPPIRTRLTVPAWLRQGRRAGAYPDEALAAMRRFVALNAVTSVVEIAAERPGLFAGLAASHRVIGAGVDIPSADLLVGAADRLPEVARGQVRWLLAIADAGTEPAWIAGAATLAAWREMRGQAPRERRLLLLPGRMPTAPPAPIPRLIMQTWKSRTDLPGRFRAWSESVIRLNPGYRHVLTDDADNRAFIQSHFPWFLDRYDAYPFTIQRVDAYRYFWLFLHGGFYLDLDIQCLKPLDRYLDAGDVVLGRMGGDADFPHSIPNAAMAARPGQEFWLFVMARLLDASPDSQPEITTGPVLLKGAVDAWLADPPAARRIAEGIAGHLSPALRSAIRRTESLTLLPPVEWYPFAWSDPLHRMVRRKLIPKERMMEPGWAERVFPRSGLITYWMGSWKSEVPGRRKNPNAPSLEIDPPPVADPLAG